MRVLPLLPVHTLREVHRSREVQCHRSREVHRSRVVHSCACAPYREVLPAQANLMHIPAQHKPIMRMFCIAALLRAGYCSLSIAS